MKFGKRRPTRFRRISVDYLDETITCQYDAVKAGKIANRLKDDFYRDDELEIQKAAMIAMFAGSIIQWSLKDDEGKPLPIRPESFDLYPGRLINLLFDAMREDIHQAAHKGR